MHNSGYEIDAQVMPNIDLMDLVNGTTIEGHPYVLVVAITCKGCRLLMRYNMNDIATKHGDETLSVQLLSPTPKGYVLV